MERSEGREIEVGAGWGEEEQSLLASVMHSLHWFSAGHRWNQDTKGGGIQKRGKTKTERSKKEEMHHSYLNSLYGFQHRIMVTFLRVKVIKSRLMLQCIVIS